MTEEAQAQRRNRKKTRSPNFPAIDLGKAIQRAQELYEEEHRHAAPFDVVVTHWGYRPTSSSAMQAVGALNAFGLIEVEGSGDEREIKLSNRGLDIVECGPESEERLKAMQEAALAPAIHREVWENYGGAKWGSDEAFRQFLIRQKGFNPKRAEPFIDQYKATISLAKLDSEGIMEVADGDESGDDGQGDRGSNPPQVKGAQMHPSSQQPPAGTLPLPVLLDDGSFQVVNIPKMTAKAFKFFKEQLEAYRSAIVQGQPESSADGEDQGEG
ncbi:MAG: hypothetical protein WD316_07250 [Phycisphaeraceae bacterium]